MAKHSFLFITLIDPLHNGAGQGLGLIDRPIIRERTTGFPMIQPSSIKGVLRDVYDEKWSPDKAKVKALFGPEPGKGEEHSGAISFGEGQLLAFPIRSLRGCFVWATSPLLLHRFKEKSVIAGVSLTKIDPLLEKVIAADKPMICDGSEDELLVGPKPLAGQPDRRPLMLEEYSYEATASLELKKFAGDVADKIFGSTFFLNAEFKKKLILLPEDTFRYFVTNATEVVPNIQIGDEGVTKDGSLRYTEYLPRESVLYSLIIHEKTKDAVLKWNDSDVKAAFDKDFSERRIQIGGDETTGKGLVSLIRIS